MSRWPRRCFHSTSPTYEIHQSFSKPMNQRVFVRFLVKFLTKCHSSSVSIETSEPFSCLRHFSSAALHLIVFSSRVYLEQTVTNVYGKPTDKREKRQTRQNYLFTYLSIVEIKRSYTEGKLNEKLQHKKVSTSAMVQWELGKWIVNLQDRSLHESKDIWGEPSTFPSPSVPCLMI